MPGHARRASQTVADVAGCGAEGSRPRDAPRGGRPRNSSPPPSAADENGRHHERNPGRHPGREQEEHDQSERQLHDLPSRTLPGDGPQAPADIAGRAAVAYGSVDVTEHPAGERGVEELRAVVRRGRGAQREGDAQAAGDEVPSPRRAHGRDEPDAGRERQRPAVDRPEPVQERAGPQPPDDDRHDRGADQPARDRPDRPLPTTRVVMTPRPG